MITACLGLSSLLLLSPSGPGQEAFEFAAEDRVVFLGNALAERMQHHGWLETALQTRFPSLQLSFRNLGFSGDELTVQQRTQGFGSWRDYLEHCEADVVLAFFGYVESFAGAAGLPKFRDDLARWIDDVRSHPTGSSAPTRLVLFTSIPFEAADSPHLPESEPENQRILAYNRALIEVGREQGVRVVDLYVPMQARYAASGRPLTLNGIHLNEAGNRALAEVIEQQLFGASTRESVPGLRELVLEKNLLWFNRYRATDGYNVYGGRSDLKYVDDLSNFEVLQRELEQLDWRTARLDHAIWTRAGARPGPFEGSLPARIEVTTNRPGDGPQGEHLFLGGEEAIGKMTSAPGMQVHLYADEARFPEIANPVQMSWDTRGRLWVATWPSYPHWKPGDAMNDALVILEDTDGDGRADRSKVFADDLHNPTGFEFWNGGVFVANAPDILFLVDTDGDDVADSRERVLHGLSSADTHHAANSFVLGPDGALYFQEGIFHQSQIESIYGPMRSRDACAWRFDPRTWRVERYMPYGFLNPHGHVFDRWGQDFITDGTGNVNYYALPATGFLAQPDKHPSTAPFFQQRSRPAAATEILSSTHFPAENQGNYLIANVIGFQGIFQYAFTEDGSGFGAREVSPVVHSSDPNFRPVDMEMGPDGALYFLDWHNPLIGHMQHHLRDPSRDKTHGRVYRVSAEGRPSAPIEDLSELTVEQLFERLRSPNDRVRYRTRIELSARPSDAVRRRALSVGARATDAHERLEALWVYLQHGQPEGEGRALLQAVAGCAEPRARAAGVRTLRHVKDRALALELLGKAIVDDHPRVRLEALVALSFFASSEHGVAATRLALRAGEGASDRFLEYAFGETLRALENDWKSALRSGSLGAEEGGPGALGHLLARLDTDELLELPPSSLVWEELLGRAMLPAPNYLAAAEGLARLRGTEPCLELLGAIERADATEGAHADHLVAGLFEVLGDRCPTTHRARLEALAGVGKRVTTRRHAGAACLTSAEIAAEAWKLAAAEGPERLLDLLEASLLTRNEQARAELFRRTWQLAEAAPAPESPRTSGRYVRIELEGADRILTLAEVEVFSGETNVAPLGKATQSSVEWGGVPERGIDGNRSGSYGDGGQTHTAEGGRDPWWELDLGASLPIDSIVLWNRTEGDYARRLDDFTLRILDEQRRNLYVHHGGRALEEQVEIELAPPALRACRAALSTLAGLDIEPERVAHLLVRQLDDPALEATAWKACRSVSFEAWPPEALAGLASRLLNRLAGSSTEKLGQPSGREWLALAKEIVPQVPEPLSGELRSQIARGPFVLVLRPVRDRMLYDRAEIKVAAGQELEIVFENTDIMPHNLLFTARGALAKVGRAAEAMASDPQAWSRSFVPDLPEVLAATELLQPGESQTLKFTAPLEPGDYPYVCTFPGHWVRMNGVLHVVPRNEAPGSPEEAASPLSAQARAFTKSWQLEDFEGQLEGLEAADPERGRAVFEAASCLVCHRIESGLGGNTGPDLREIVGRYEPGELLTQILLPSQRIAEGYGTEIFVTTDGKLHAGPVLEETEAYVLVRDDPYREDALEIPKEEIEERSVSSVSGMPSGLLSTFSREEVLDLLAFLRSLSASARD